ncbi:hypothetical protein Tsubulata_032475 [Turnera subulata]|uniref:non-specific serine/threonine protein kinase n=1 Tax=Turnera subulata TaxID=218843 RepID=A0A9Q0JHC4_9ROSI|nr:hypothetical protein Tsubulata_032475 [Turnera subulata]
MGVVDIYNSATLSLIKPSNNLHQAAVAQSPICLFQRNKQRRVISMASTVTVEHVNDGQERVTGDSFIRSHLRKLSPYQPILPFEVIEALGSLKFPYIYPDPQSRRLREALAKDSGLDSDHILVGCGADELIDLIMRCTLDPGDKIVDCPPTFTMYAFDAAVNGALVTKVLRKPDFSLDVENIVATVRREKPKCIFLTSPNNPDGSVISDEDLVQILQLPILVVLDEAYIEFSGLESRMKWVKKHDNLIVLRTFSKRAGLAGLRVGYGAFPLSIIEFLWRAKQPYNVSVAAEVSACAALQNPTYLETVKDALVKERERLFMLLNGVPFLKPFPSYSNFILCEVKSGMDAKKLKLRCLGRFVLSDNNLSGQLPHGLYNISSIEFIDVHNNRLNGSIPSDIGLTLPRLLYLGLTNNSFTGLIPQTLSNASRLKTIVFGDNYFRGPIPKDLGRLPQLQYLIFGENQLEDDLSFINSLTNCSHLFTIDIHQNFFRGQIPKFIGNLSADLGDMRLANNQLRGAIPIEIEYLSGLEFLSLNQNFLSGPIHHINFSRLQHLQRLNVGMNKLSGRIPSTIGNLGMLSILVMSFNNFGGVLPPSLGSCRSLVALGLSHNNLGGSIPKELLSLGSLSIALDLSANRLTGSLPPEIDRLRNLGWLNISDNKLVGIIPDSIAGCSSMEELYLGGNYFAGEIPHALSSLRGLRILDISRNNLSGKIPDFLSRLTLLNLSMNQLQGEVPKQGIFLNASAISLLGNKDLCGGISQLKLPSCLNTEGKKSNLHLIWEISIPIVIAVVLIFSVACCLIRHQRKFYKKNMAWEVRCREKEMYIVTELFYWRCSQE